MGRVKNKILNLALRVGLGLASIGGASLSGCARSVNYPPIFGVSPADSEMIKYVETRGGDINKDGLEDAIIKWKTGANNKKEGIEWIVIPLYNTQGNGIPPYSESINLNYRYKDKTHFNIYLTKKGSKKINLEQIMELYPLMANFEDLYPFTNYEDLKNKEVGNKGIEITNKEGELVMRIIRYGNRGVYEWVKIDLDEYLRIEEFDKNRRLKRITIVNIRTGEVMYAVKWNDKKSRYEILKNKFTPERFEKGPRKVNSLQRLLEEYRDKD